ncbi:hypothetical protein KGMB01110_04650 [Mediterraneibacter butyricigenes]|uniref:DUF1492 domain-containing protein n=1 Tax=Mediterraneibacter butyricigenes TaxID=2316025 RepID=A0A391P8K3_9FIRM|nr:hypothetical protein [Mediterraneibacter butyricigenes]GCA66029.1 hypothetical protein KGMB01110_04650 [Mediterraneibacter butyricigenes]
MERNILVEYADMLEEIKDLRRRIQDDQKKINQLSQTIVSDSVTCGKKGKKPLRTVKIKGFPNMEINRRIGLLKKRKAKMMLLESDLLEKQIQVEEYIDGIDKSELRMMFRLYYLDNLTWYQVALQMNQIFPKRRIKYTEDSCRMRNKRYFEKIEEN